MNTLSIFFIIAFSAAFLFAIYRVFFANDESTEDEETRPEEPEEDPGDGVRIDDPNFNPEDPVDRDPVEIPDDPKPVDREEITVENLNIPTRAHNALKDAGIETTADLAEYDDYTEIPGIGGGYADDIRLELREE